jgi:hypothetical protein
MKHHGSLAGILIFALLLSGCGKEPESPGTSAAPPPAKPAPQAAPSADIPRASICLNGEWDFLPVIAEAQKAEPPKDGWRKVRVPSVWWRNAGRPAGAKSFNFEFDLPEDVAKARAAWYHLRFLIPKEWADGRRVALEFGGINCRSRIFINGESTEETTGAHLPISVDLTKRARFGQHNEVAVLVEDGSPERKLAGLWRSVYLRCYPTLSIQSVIVTTSVRKKEIALRVWLRNDSGAAHRVVLKNAIRECGADKVVNIFGDLPTGIEADESKVVEVRRVWSNPRLWGFGEYGEPLLYMLATELRAADSGAPTAASPTLDALNTRFGFRELWTSGRQFLFNGKPFFIKGDVFSPAHMLVHNREFVTLFYQAERAANVNFIRLHDPDDFAPPVWFDVADELGMLIEVEAGSGAKKVADGIELPDEGQFERLQKEWTQFVLREGNHPSIAMYSCDNEICSQGEDRVDGSVFSRLSALHEGIRQTDPTRIVEEQGDVQLGMAAKLGIFEELQVFNAHPTGHPLGRALEQLKLKYDYSDLIPIHVGEIRPTDNDPFNAWTRPAEMLRRKQEMFQAWKTAGEYFAESIAGVKDAGAAGASLGSGIGTMYFGAKSADDLQFGPWDVRATDESFDDPKAWDGRGRPVNLVYVQPRWPSLSGEGMKVCWIDASTSPTGCGAQFNWFDPTRPAYLTNVTYDLVKKGFRAVDGKDTAPLAAKRASEVVVGLAPDGKPAAGAYVYIARKDQERRGAAGVMTDAAGAAWFTPQEPGEYEAWAIVEGKRFASSFAAQASELAAKPGYSHVTWVDLTPSATEKIKAQIAKPATIEIRDKMDKPQNTPPAK